MVLHKLTMVGERGNRCVVVVKNIITVIMVDGTCRVGVWSIWVRVLTGNSMNSVTHMLLLAFQTHVLCAQFFNRNNS